MKFRFFSVLFILALSCALVQASRKDVVSKYIVKRDSWVKDNFRRGVYDDKLPPFEMNETKSTITDSQNFTSVPFKPNPFSSIYKNAILWSINESDGLYYIPWDIETLYPSSMIDKIKWSMDYLERGSNLRFVPRNSSHSIWINFVHRSGSGCSSTIGMCSYGACNVNLEYDMCDEKHSIVHELLHRVGFAHEHQRSDNYQYIKVSPDAPSDWLVWLQPDNGLTTDTPYDIASIMHYDTYLDPIDPSHERALRSRVPALTSCDYWELNYIYPGNENTVDRKGSPECLPHVMPEVVFPTKVCLEYWGSAACESYCYDFFDTEGILIHTDDSREYVALCEFEDGAEFPKDTMTDWKPRELQGSDKCIALLGCRCCKKYCENPAVKLEGIENGLCEDKQ